MFWLFACVDAPKPPVSTPADPCALPPVAAPACGTAVARGSVIPGPADPDFEPALDARAAAIERQANGLTTWANGATTEVSIADAAHRDAVGAWISGGDGWDLESGTGLSPGEVVTSWGAVAGAYAGVSIAADAWRYGALRDEGAPCAEVDAARAQLLVGMEALHTAMEITGVPGVIARGFARADLPGAGEVETTALFDDAGNPLPEEKDNGTWREDQSGLHPELVWVDSASRDQLIGWAMGMAAVWEVGADDPSLPEEALLQLQSDTRAMLTSLMTVQESGYDLEIRDADGRMTYHGILHEASVDRVYVPGAMNPLNAAMALGIVSGLAIVAEDPAVDAYVAELVGTRDLPGIVRDFSRVVELGTSTNYSNYNMIFEGGFMATRYVCDTSARSAVAAGMHALYQGEDRDPIEQDQAFYHLVEALGQGASSARVAGGAEAEALTLALGGLDRMRPAPFWDLAVTNCDEAEISAGVCTLVDGSVVTLLGEVGHNDALVSEEPIPLSVRPPSNYYWRSNPYEVNGGGDGAGLYPNVDWRLVYWAGRWAR